MSIYLKDIPLKKALNFFQQELASRSLKGVLWIEILELDEKCVGRTLASPVWAKMSYPHYYAAAMDGFAVNAAITSNASPSSPKLIEVIQSGHVHEFAHCAVYLDTGDPMPTWANAIIPIEMTEPILKDGRRSNNIRSPEFMRIREPVTPWQNVRSLGEDVLEGELVLPPGHVLHPADLGVIAASGHSAVEVSRKPSIGIIPTGSEVIPIGNSIKPGSVIEFNSIILAGQINDWGGVANRYAIVPDIKDELIEAISIAAKKNDLILVIAGSSAGADDYTASVVAELGHVFVHGIAVRPGHPVILGIVDKLVDHSDMSDGLSRSVPIIGIPGYPVSAALTSEIFVKPLISEWSGKRLDRSPVVKAKLSRKITSPPGDDDYVRVNLGMVDNEFIVSPLPRGAGIISSLARADGILVIPTGIQGLSAGVEVDVQLLRTPDELESTIFIIGSHDLCIDILTLYLQKKNRRMVSSNVGSLSGLLALKNGTAHLAGSHLLDGNSGEYNVSFIKKYLPDQEIKIVRFINRIQGLLVKSGNPKKISALSDLVNPDIIFINRQRGSGTRILLDFHLENMMIDTKKINGYDREEYSHLAIAAAVESGKVDCGLGIAAAASIMNLDFIPLFEEKYDLIIPGHLIDSNLLDPIFEILQDEKFRLDVLSKPGYSISNMGEIISV